MNLFPKKIVGIDLHDYSAQVVELELANNKISLEAYNRICIPPNIIKNGEIVEEDVFRTLIKTFLQKSNPKPIDTKKVAIIFPSTKVFTHIFSFPINLDENEIRKALPYEAETVIPFSIQDVYWDFTILEEEGKSKKHATKYILFAAIPKETADKYTELLESIGLIPFLFGIEVESLKYGLIKQLEPGKASLIIDIGTLCTNYLIIRNNTIKHFFSSSKGGKQLVDSLSKEFQSSEKIIIDQKEKNKLDPKYTPQISKFIENKYKRGEKIIKEKEKAIGPINNIYLTGEFLNLPNFYETAKKIFLKKNVFIGDPRKYLDIDASKFKSLEKETIQYSTYFINAVGIALRGLIGKASEGINLLPDKIKQSFSNKKTTVLFAFTSVFMCAVSLFMATFMFFNHQGYVYERLNLEIQKSSIDKILYGVRYQEIRDEINNFNNEVTELNNIENSLFSLPKLIKDVEGLIPNGITLTGLKFIDSDLSVEITGIAQNRKSLLEANSNFKEADFVSEVETPISNYDEKYQISFVTKLKLIFKELEPYGGITNT